MFAYNGCLRCSKTILCHIFNICFFSKFALAVKGFDRKEVIPCHFPPRIASHIFNVLPSHIFNVLPVIFLMYFPVIFLTYFPVIFITYFNVIANKQYSFYIIEEHQHHMGQAHHTISRRDKLY